MREFFLAFDGETYFYPTGHWFKIECQDQADTKSRPAGLKYSLKFFDADGNCLVRFDNSHPPHRRGRPRPAAFDHWHRQTARGEELVPYQFTAVEQLLADFFAAVDRYLPPELRSSG
ncbi:MAG TPA: DUF6516 family protein [Stellaceae bacterium]|nr:DUF6516 family protein [Stellaceae bacterium]